MINLTETAKIIHQNAVDHGFWEGKRDTDALFALVHDEWSEALEEDRAGHPPVWAMGGDADDFPKMITDMAQFGRLKPEGACVELMDGVIRILDLMAAYGLAANAHVTAPVHKPESLPHLIAMLHENTTNAWKGINRTDGTVRNVHFFCKWLNACISLVWWWIDYQGFDPMQILEIKHNYNKGRSYRHGKRY